eukprot:TRINITY_DN3621_c0_g1_i1.p1 TRINITY_DN3621_c0_g1~~TRINITY_DN3621_c0_g1_i1.p1  ORF type:complete len:211 (+),score=47.95 TRINITY_DN3621_c0_g1_i1:27-635(+)
MEEPQAPSTVVSSEWENILAKIQSFSLSPPTILVCGGKHVGKSTFCRFLLNSLLKQFSKVLFMETDIGRSEFTPYGCVSLNLVSQHVSGLPYTHLQPPIRSHFIGASTPKEDPEFYLENIKCLLKFKESNKELDKYPLIINTQGWVTDIGYDCLLEISKMSNPNFILYIQNKLHYLQKLCTDLSPEQAPDIDTQCKKRGCTS